MSALTPELIDMAGLAKDCLLAQTAMPITHPAGWNRDGLPLPIKRMNPNADGTVTQDYRPMAILEYVQEVLSGEMAKRRAADRKAKQQEGEAA